MSWWEAILLALGGVAAGAINSMAGGGSMLTVPLLTLFGVPGNAANGTNRVGIMTSNAAAAATFRNMGVDGLAGARRVVVPALVGSLVGSYGINRLTDDTFETVFALLMIPLVLLTIFKPKPSEGVEPWPPVAVTAAFLVVGMYGGAIQAGVGLIMIAALSRAGFDLVTANAVKVLVNLAITTVALVVFIANGNLRWVPAIILAAGLTAGAWLGARWSVQGGERVIRAVMVAAAIALAGNLLGVWSWIWHQLAG